MNRFTKKGFTLVEIMVVIAIVIILVALAVPNILRSRIVANEGAALANMKVINDACQAYHVNAQSYPDSLLSLIEPISNPPYIDSTLASGNKQGYQFIYAKVDADHFTLHADSSHTGLLKGRSFYSDESQVVRFNSSSQAGPGDEIVK